MMVSIFFRVVDFIHLNQIIIKTDEMVCFFSIQPSGHPRNIPYFSWFSSFNLPNVQLPVRLVVKVKIKILVFLLN
jgi:hypothetical protein